jgi:hypothetical protein
VVEEATEVEEVEEAKTEEGAPGVVEADEVEEGEVDPLWTQMWQMLFINFSPERLIRVRSSQCGDILIMRAIPKVHSQQRV